MGIFPVQCHGNVVNLLTMTSEHRATEGVVPGDEANLCNKCNLLINFLFCAESRMTTLTGEVKQRNEDVSLGDSYLKRCGSLSVLTSDALIRENPASD